MAEERRSVASLQAVCCMRKWADDDRTGVMRSLFGELWENFSYRKFRGGHR